LSGRLFDNALAISQESKAIDDLQARFAASDQMPALTAAKLSELIYSHHERLQAALKQERALLGEVQAAPHGGNGARSLPPLLDTAIRNLTLCKELTLANSPNPRSAEKILAEMSVIAGRSDRRRPPSAYGKPQGEITDGKKEIGNLRNVANAYSNVIAEVGLFRAKSAKGNASLPAAPVCMTALGLMIAGCGGSSVSSSSAKAGSISIANSSGTTGITSLAVATTAQLSMTPVNDVSKAGVDWTVTCGGNPTTGSITNGGCGTLSPAHTADGGTTVYTAPSQIPINTWVTITATVTSNPSQSSSASLTIVASTIGVTIRVGALTPADTMQINQTVGIGATVTNDPTDAGVIWTATCGSSVCGSFNSTQTGYTAPSVVPTGGTVTITATSHTDTTKSASVKLTITNPPAPVPVTVSVLPSTVYVTTNGTTHSTSLTAMVANDSAAAGVDWSLSCSGTSCGTLNGSKTAHTASGVAVNFVSPSQLLPTAEL
jgi:hypothetical protein